MASDRPGPYDNGSYSGLPNASSEGPLAPPNPRFSMFGAPTTGDSLRDSAAGSALGSGSPSANNSALLLTEKAQDGSPRSSAALDVREKMGAGGQPGFFRRHKLLVLGGLAAAAVVVALAVALPLTLINNNNNKSSDDSSSGSGGSGGGGNNGGDGDTPVRAITGGDGSTVTTEDGTTFTYVNKFGGYWVQDPADPLNNGARPNSWTPALNETWDWSTDRINGVNVGGLFVLEPFISPAPFERYPGSTDEWTLSELMAADTANGGLAQLEEHYDTFITEQDFAEIAGAGLNWIRLPVPFWAIETWEGEPFLEKACWKYILRVFRWARKYGIRIKLDLHTIPGSQNGYNHSGRFGQINFLNGVMGLANAERALDYIRIFTQFISQSEYKDVVQMWGIVNEPRMSAIGKDALANFNYRAYEMIRSITGIGEGNGAFISYHDGFAGLAEWADFLPNADRIVIDMHPYFAFNGQPNTEPLPTWPVRACTVFSPMINNSIRDFGVTVAGEYSNAINDCGIFLNGVGGTATYGGDCSFWEDSSQWNQTVKDGIRDFQLASMDALRNYFFWTWKIGNSTVTNRVGSPLWSYQLGLQEGFMPTDPREAFGFCDRLGVSVVQAPAALQPWQTGGAGAGDIPAAALATASIWPPAALNGVGGAAIAVLPTYTATGTVQTLPADTLTAVVAGQTSAVDSGDGWANDADAALGITEVAGCPYPDPWLASGVAAPAAACTGAPAARLRGRSMITPAPML